MKTLWLVATMQRGPTWLKLILMIQWLAFLALMVFGSAVAHADPMDMDQQFIELAQRDGFGHREGMSSLIGAAHQVCQMRMNGYSESAVINDVYLESSLTQRSTAAALVHDAEQVYCPGYYASAGGSVA